MSEEKIELTAEGLAEIKAELKQLVSVERPLIVTQLKEARSQGDLSENADYSASKDALGNIDGKIADLEYRISNVAIISNAGSSIVKLGSQVEVEINGKKVWYTIVGEFETNPMAGKISNKSPLGVALLGNAVGDTLSISNIKKPYRIKIISIK